MKNVVLSGSRKGHLFTGSELNKEGRMFPALGSAEKEMQRASQSIGCSARVHMSRKHVGIGLRATNTFQQTGRIANMESASKKRR